MTQDLHLAQLRQLRGRLAEEAGRDQVLQQGLGRRLDVAEEDAPLAGVPHVHDEGLVPAGLVEIAVGADGAHHFISFPMAVSAAARRSTCAQVVFSVTQ